MPIDPLLVNGIVPVISPVQAEAQAMSLRDMMSQNAMQQEQLKALQMQNAQTAQAQARDQQYREYVMNQAQQSSTLAPASGIQGLVAGPAGQSQTASPQANDESGQPDSQTVGQPTSQPTTVPIQAQPPAMPGPKVGAAGMPVADWRTEVQNLRARGFIDQANALQTAGIANDTKIAETAKNQAEAENDQMSALEKRHGAVAGALKTILDADPADRPAIYQQLRARMASEGHLSPSEMPDTYPGDQAVQALAGQMTDVGKQVDIAKDARAARMDALDRELKDAQARQAQLAAYGMEHPNDPAAQRLALTPEQRANADARVAEITKLNTPAELAFQAADTRKTPVEREVANAALQRLDEYQKAGRNVSQTANLSPEAIQMLAASVAGGGQLPNLGRNAGGAIAQVMNQAAQQSPDLNSAKANYRADTGSLAALQKQRDTIASFENTAGKNLDQFIETAKKTVDSKSPLINSPLRKLSDKMFGDTDQTAFNTARQVAVTEIAKVLNNPSGNAALSDSARKEVQELIGPDATLKQIYRAASVLRADMKNRAASMDQQLGEIKGRMKPGGSSAVGAQVEKWVRDKDGNLVKQ